MSSDEPRGTDPARDESSGSESSGSDAGDAGGPGAGVGEPGEVLGLVGGADVDADDDWDDTWGEDDDEDDEYDDEEEEGEGTAGGGGFGLGGLLRAFTGGNGGESRGGGGGLGDLLGGGLPSVSSLLEGFGRVRGMQDATYEGSAGGGLVRIRATGRMEVESVEIEPGAIEGDPPDVELLADLVLAALRDLHAHVADAQKDAMGPLGGLLGG